MFLSDAKFVYFLESCLSSFYYYHYYKESDLKR